MASFATAFVPRLPGVWARDDKAKNYRGVYSMAREANGRLTGAAT